MNRTALTETEKELLRNYLKSSPIALIRFKAQAIMMLDGGLKQEEVSQYVLKKERTIQKWLQDWKKIRMGSLFSGHVNNSNASKLTREQKAEIRGILAKPPTEYSLPKGFWDVPQLKDYIRAEFGIEYESDRSYYYLLKFSKLSFKYPDKQSPRRDEALIKKTMNRLKRELRREKYRNTDWVILAADETRIQTEAEIRRAWLPKGIRTIVKTERSIEKQNYLGFLNQKNGKCEVFQIKRGNTEEIVRVLRELVTKYPQQKICIVWDNAGWHKSKGLREKLGYGKEFARIKLMTFPPYAPECNPIEHIWQYAKSRLANKSSLTISEIDRLFTREINSRTFNYQI